MQLSYRIIMAHWAEDEPFERLLAVLKQHRSAVDEISLFNGTTGHGYTPLDEMDRRSRRLTVCVKRLHDEGFGSAGINMLATLGHRDLPGGFLPELPFQAMVGHEGKISVSCPCANTAEFRAYIQEKYRLMALAGPDFIWVDDDLRLTANGVQFPCFCPTCLGLFGRETNREALVAQLNQPGNRVLREAWVEFNCSTLESVCRDIAAAVHEVNSQIDVGLMTYGPSLNTYSGQDWDRWLKALGGKRARPAHGFYEDSRPRDLIHKALELGRQTRSFPQQVTNIQYELENYPYIDLDKSVQTLINESTVALAAGCNGVAYAMLKAFAGTLEDFTQRITAIEWERPHWELLSQAAEGTFPVGLWAVQTDHLMARRRVDERGWFWDGGPYSVSQTDTWAELGFPVTAEREHSCGTLLPGKICEALDDVELRQILSGGVILDGLALQELWQRGLGKFTGVKPGQAYQVGLWEYYTDHTLNGIYAGDSRATFVEGPTNAACELLPVGADVGDLAHLRRVDGRDLGMCVSIFQNELGGRVAVRTYSPWTALGTLPERAQMLALAEWISGRTLPLVINRNLRLAPFMRCSADGQRFVLVLLNASLDDTGPFECKLRGKTRNVVQLQVNGVTPTTHSLANDGIIVNIANIPAWHTLTLAEG
jgi:hypothetical protein